MSLDKKNILISGLDLDHGGGVKTCVFNYIRNIVRNKSANLYFSFRGKDVALKAEIEALGAHVILLPNKKESLIRQYIETKKMFKNNSFDLVWDNKSTLTDLSIISLAKKYGVKKRIIHSHLNKNWRTGIMKYMTSIFHFFNKMRVKRVATNYWACSHQAAKYFYRKSIINSGEFRIIPNAIDVSLFSFGRQSRKKYRDKLGLDNFYTLINVAKLARRKNQSFLLKTLVELNKLIPSKLILLGEGEDYAKLNETASNLNIKDKVIFAGYQPNVVDYLNASDAFVFPSTIEGFGIAPLEAQANGMDIFCSVFVPSDVKINDNVYFLPIKNSREWANFIYTHRANNRVIVDKQRIKQYEIKKQIFIVEKILLD